MKMEKLRLPLAALAVLAATAVAAEEIELALLQCAPIETASSSAVAPICPSVASERVVIEDCACPDGFSLVRLTTPAAITVEAVPNSL